MNQLLLWLSEGDLRSDGLANEVAALVLADPEAFSDLFDGLSDADDVVRGHAADALEKVARSRPDLVVVRLPEIVQVAEREQVPMVLMHVAMILGHIAGYASHIEQISGALVLLLNRDSVFVRSWAITGLCIIGTLYPGLRSRAVDLIAPLQVDASAAIRTRVRKALEVLTQEGATFPKGWVKSDFLKYLEGGSPVAWATVLERDR
jgi:HEAT repeat protein